MESFLTPLVLPRPRGPGREVLWVPPSERPGTRPPLTSLLPPPWPKSLSRLPWVAAEASSLASPPPPVSLCGFLATHGGRTLPCSGSHVPAVLSPGRTSSPRTGRAEALTVSGPARLSRLISRPRFLLAGPWAPSLSRECARHVPASGPLHVLSGTLFSQRALPSRVCREVSFSARPSLTTPSDSNRPHP